MRKHVFSNYWLEKVQYSSKTSAQHFFAKQKVLERSKASLSPCGNGSCGCSGDCECSGPCDGGCGSGEGG